MLTTIAISIEHFGSGLGTTVLFAALMSATRPADAGLHYTILTSANAMAIGVGGLVGGLIADRAGLLVGVRDGHGRAARCPCSCCHAGARPRTQSAREAGTDSTRLSSRSRARRSEDRLR